MRSATTGMKVQVVVTGRRVQVVVEIERNAATVSGRTAADASAAVEFYGWLELIDQLESALDQATKEKERDDICNT